MSRSFEEARRAVIEELLRVPLPKATAEEVALQDAAGRVLAEDVRADRDQPPFDRSTRDGYAVRSADVGASPATLRVIGEAAAGGGFSGSIGAGECVEIMTGAPVPSGTDAVVMVEHTERAGDSTVTVKRTVAVGENMVPAGSELGRGAIACARGTRLDPARVALLASVGQARPSVHPRPRVAILTTGDELVRVDETPGPSQIRSSNSVSLAAQVARAGGAPVSLPTVSDRRDALHEGIGHALAAAELLLVTGGVSMGKYDLVEGVLAELGATVVFDGVDIRPGKPVVFGRVGGKPYFGLPGNPLSAMVTFELFARPAVEVLGGQAAPPLRFLRVPLSSDYQQRALPLTVFLPAVLEGELGSTTVRPLSSKGSGDLAAMARADCLLVIPPGVTSVRAGETVSVMPK